MMTRLLVAVTTGFGMTLGLFFLMHSLIASGVQVVTEVRDPPMLGRVRVPEEVIVDFDTPSPEPIVPPPVPPPIRPPEEATETPFDAGVYFKPAEPRYDTSVIGRPGQHDGPLINIIKVQPSYPPVAAARGLEGTVIVRFDVSAMGTVENVSVVESSNRVFDKAAIEAAYRFKYRPQVIDGTAYPTRGLQQLFRFEMKH